MKKTFCILFILIAFHANLFGQKTSKFQVWNDFNLSFSLSQHWKLGGDIGYRFQPNISKQTFYLRPILAYKLNKLLKLSAGMANFNNWEPGGYTSFEFRTFQYLSVQWPRLGNFQVKHRLGFEQRWFYFPTIDTRDYTNRTRYYLEIKSPSFKLFGLEAPFFLVANLEILRNLGSPELSRLIDHNRYTFGIGNNISDRLRAEIRYKYINAVDPLTSSFIREINIIRIRLYYKFAST